MDEALHIHAIEHLQVFTSLLHSQKLFTATSVRRNSITVETASKSARLSTTSARPMHVFCHSEKILFLVQIPKDISTARYKHHQPGIRSLKNNTLTILYGSELTPKAWHASEFNARISFFRSPTLRSNEPKKIIKGRLQAFAHRLMALMLTPKILKRGVPEHVYFLSHNPSFLSVTLEQSCG